MTPTQNRWLIFWVAELPAVLLVALLMLHAHSDIARSSAAPQNVLPPDPIEKAPDSDLEYATLDLAEKSMPEAFNLRTDGDVTAAAIQVAQQQVDDFNVWAATVKNERVRSYLIGWASYVQRYYVNAAKLAMEHPPGKSDDDVIAEQLARGEELAAKLPQPPVPK